MAAAFDRWEKDPFFSAAEEVQESADRMESSYRTWLHSTKDTSSSWNLEDLRRDLSTALDTAKWQLEEFERAVRNSYKNDGADEAEAKDRHRQFVLAMEDKVSLIQKSLQDSAASDGKLSAFRVRWDEGERDELALFLSGPIGPVADNGTNSLLNDEISASNCIEVNDGRLSGHRRTASASADISSWNIAIREEESASDSSSGPMEVLPRRVPSFSAIIGALESVPKLKLPKNGFRKWRTAEHQQEEDVAFLRSQPQSRVSNPGYERNKSCLDSCDDCYDKQLYGWYGAIHRLLQRSLYQVRYIRSIQVAVWAALLLFFIVLFLVRAF